MPLYFRWDKFRHNFINSSIRWNSTFNHQWKTYNPDAETNYIVAGGQTLIPGGAAITINNIPYAMPSSITALILRGFNMSTAPNSDPARLSTLGSATTLIESNN